MSRKIPESQFIGKKFGHLTPTKDLGPNEDDKLRRRQVLCLCDCGNETKKYLVDLMRGHIVTCSLSCPLNNTHISKTTHGMTHSREYRIWRNIKSRCLNSKSTNYHLYGGRGIKICPEWENSFEQFLNDMGPAPSEIHSIDRINSDGNYEKDNCRWATPEEQGQNTRRTIFTPETVKQVREMFANGKTRKEISEIFECNISTVNNIIRNVSWKNVK